MSQFESRASELRELIDRLTDDIAAKVTNDLLDDIDALLNQRHVLLAELIAIPVTDEHKEHLLNYLNLIRERDQVIMCAIKDDRDKVKTALSKMGQLKNYLSD